MLGVFRIIHDLGDIILIRTLQEDDPGPPLPEITADLDVFVLTLPIFFSPAATLPELLGNETLITVIFVIERPALKPVCLLDDLIHDLFDMFSPDATIEIKRSFPILPTGKGGTVPSGIRGIHMRNAVPEKAFIVRKPGRRLEQRIRVGNMLELVVSGEEAWRHGLSEVLKLIRRNQAGRITVKPADIRHQRKDVFFMPGRPDIHDPPAAIPDILQLVILQFDPIPLSPGDTILDGADIVRDNIEGMGTGDR